jgi:hypothetical protein
MKGPKPTNRPTLPFSHNDMVKIEIPDKEQILTAGCEVVVAGLGGTWKESCLGQKAKERGVYVIHHRKNIVYVGKTNGPTMSFGMRLRREFQATAPAGWHIYPLLSSLTVPPSIMVSLFTADELRKLAHTG